MQVGRFSGVDGVFGFDLLPLLPAVRRIEPQTAGWETRILPLSYSTVSLGKTRLADIPLKESNNCC